MANRRLRLGVNIDHVATLREQRHEKYPDVVRAAREALKGGANGIVCHLREDRRHIQDADLPKLRALPCHFDLEMAATKEMQRIALRIKPDMVTLVPERRQELTTEGGLDVSSRQRKLLNFIRPLQKAGIEVFMFVEPRIDQIRASANIGADGIEIHTGGYANAKTLAERKKMFTAVKDATDFALRLQMIVNVGHGLDYNNVEPFVKCRG